MSWASTKGIFLRHFYSFRRNPSGFVDLFLWPSVDLLVWGLLTTFIKRNNALPIPVGFLLGAALLWTLMFRSSIEVSVAFLDDTSWTHNIINLMVAPLRPIEYLGGTSLWALAKVAGGWSIMVVAAFLLFHFSLFGVGFVLSLFMLALMIFGFVLSLGVLGIVMRFGHGADILAWGLTGIFTPLSAVWYPISIMPSWAQAIARALPSAQVFEGMRQVVAGGAIPWHRLGTAFGLDLIYLVAMFFFAGSMFGTLRRRGYITRYM